MEKDKSKIATANTLMVRAGALVITLPIVVGLGGMLIATTIALSSLIYEGLLANLAPLLVTLIGICLITFFALARATLKYTGGIGNLVNRLRGMQQEQARVERLMTPESQQDNLEISAWFDDDSQQHMKKR